MDEKTLLMGVVTKTLNVSEQEATDLLYQKDGDELVLKEEAMDVVLELDSARVERIKKDAPIDKERLSNEYKRGQKEHGEGIESSIKEKYSLESDKKGIELIDEVIVSKSKAPKLSDVEVKKHPLYIELETKRVPKEDHDKVVEEYDNFKKGIEADKKFATIENIAGELLDGMKPIVSENPAVAKTRRQDFLRKFREYVYEGEGDNMIILNKDGSRREDGHGNPIPFSKLVKDLAISNYDFPAQSQRGNSGGEDDDGDRTNLNITVPKTEAEYAAAIRGTTDLATQKAIKTAYNASLSQQ